jgi:hypothetical protein
MRKLVTEVPPLAEVIALLPATERRDSAQLRARLLPLQGAACG